MGRAVDRRAAGVDADDVAERLERPGLAGERVAAAGSSRAAAPASAIASAEIDRPAPSSPARLPVEALTLTATASTPSSAGDRGAHRVELAGQARPRRDDRQVDVPTAPAGRGHAPDDLGEQLARGDPLGRRGSGREEPAEVAEARGAEQRVADGVERDVAVGVAVQARRARRSRCRRARAGSRARTGGCPGRSRRGTRGAGEGRLGPPEVVGQRHLEVARIAGDDMDRDSTGLQQRGLVGPRLGTVRAGIARTPRAADRRPDALRRLGGAERRRGRRSRRRPPPSTRLRVSATGRTGIAAPWARRRVDDGPDHRRGRRAAARRRGRGRPGQRRRPPASSLERRDAGRDRFLPAIAARDDRDDRARRASRPPRTSATRSGAATTTIRSTSGTAARPSSVQARSGRPATDRRQSLSTPPIRRERAGGHDDRVGAGGPRGVRTSRSVEARLGEDHPPGDGLEDARDRDVDVAVDEPRAALDDDHRAVVEEADALAGLLALLDDPDAQLLARAARPASRRSPAS